ncbi:ComEC/Rec2 family competence protein [Komagataeibacter rhaeticus]|nr:ComEC/Rec2 family competence protein [Komagataeibacter rhaeticus]
MDAAGRRAHGPPLLASVLAGSACLPVGMAHFGTVQPWFVLANLLAVPLMSVWIMPWGWSRCCSCRWGRKSWRWRPWAGA